MTIGFIVYLGVGKLLITLGQKFIHDTQIRFINKLFLCDLCLGVWVYSILAGLLHIRLLEDVYIYIPIVFEIVTGCVASFLMHLLAIGFKEKYLNIVIN